MSRRVVSRSVPSAGSGPNRGGPPIPLRSLETGYQLAWAAFKEAREASQHLKSEGRKAHTTKVTVETEASAGDPVFPAGVPSCIRERYRVLEEGGRAGETSASMRERARLHREDAKRLRSLKGLGCVLGDHVHENYGPVMASGSFPWKKHDPVMVVAGGLGFSDRGGDGSSGLPSRLGPKSGLNRTGNQKVWMPSPPYCSLTTRTTPG